MDVTESARSTKYRTRRSSSPPSKRSLGFSTPSNVVSLPPHFSPANSQDESTTDRVLTFLQSARDRDVPVRFGKWSPEEDAYLAKLLFLFESGLLAEMEPKTSLRSYLALMLNCCPMRISKKQMHGHRFVGKTKYQRRVTKLTQQQYDQLSHEVATLRDAFLKAWVRDEYTRRSNSSTMDDRSFQDWYRKVVQMVPTPKLARRPSLKEFKPKRWIKALKLQDQQDKKYKGASIETEPVKTVEQVHDITEEPEGAQVEMIEPVEILPIEPTPFSTSSSCDNVVMPLPTAYCSDSINMSEVSTKTDRSFSSGHWNDLLSVNVQDTRYNFDEDEVPVSRPLGDQRYTTELSMTRQSSRLVIDFDAPSCWYTCEEPKCSFSECSQWTDSDITEEWIMTTQPGVFGLDDSLVSPTFN